MNVSLNIQGNWNLLPQLLVLVCPNSVKVVITLFSTTFKLYQLTPGPVRLVVYGAVKSCH